MLRGSALSNQSRVPSSRAWTLLYQSGESGSVGAKVPRRLPLVVTEVPKDSNPPSRHLVAGMTATAEEMVVGEAVVAMAATPMATGMPTRGLP